MERIRNHFKNSKLFIFSFSCILLVAFLSLIFTIFAFATAPSNMECKGVVYDKNDQVVPGITVAALDSKGSPVEGGVTTTDENGHYTVDVDATNIPSYWLVKDPNLKYTENLEYFIITPEPQPEYIRDFHIHEGIPGSFAGASDDKGHNGFKAISYFDGELAATGEVKASDIMNSSLHNGAAVGIISKDGMSTSIHYSYDNEKGPHVDTYMIPIANDGYQPSQWTVNDSPLQNDVDPQMNIGDDKLPRYDFVCSYKSTSPGVGLVSDVNIEFVDGGIN